MQKMVGLHFFLSGTPTFSSGTPTFCQMGVLNSCFQNPSESSASQMLSFYLTKASAKFEVATCMSNDLGGDAFTRNYIISP